METQFQKANLQGKNFRGKNLKGLNFSGADIRGADFTNADLSNAKFNQAIAGLSSFSLTNFSILFILFSFLAGLCSGYGGAIIGDIITHESKEITLFSLAVIAIFVLFIIRVRKSGTTLIFLTEIITTSLFLATLITTIMALVPSNEWGQEVTKGSILTYLALIATIAGFFNMTISVGLAKILFLRAPKQLSSVIAIFGAIVGTSSLNRQIEVYIVAGIISFIIIILGVVNGWKDITGDKKDWLFHRLTLTIVMTGGTKFNGANLTDADFTDSVLNYTDFSKALLTNTRWQQAKGLHLAKREVINFYETLDLSLQDTITPTAVAIALEKLSKKYSDKLEVLAIESVGNQDLKFHTVITDSVSQLQLSKELKKIMHQTQLLIDTNIKDNQNKILLEEKNNHIERLSGMILKALQTPNFYSQINQEIKELNQSYNEYIFNDKVASVNNNGIQSNIAGINQGNQIKTEYKSQEK